MLAWALIAASAFLLLGLVRQIRRPRIAYRDGEVLFNLRAGKPVAVPREVVEAFFLGQGPAYLPHTRGARRRDGQSRGPAFAKGARVDARPREAGARPLVRRLRHDPRHLVRAAERRRDSPAQCSAARAADCRSGRRRRSGARKAAPLAASPVTRLTARSKRDRRRAGTVGERARRGRSASTRSPAAPIGSISRSRGAARWAPSTRRRRATSSHAVGGRAPVSAAAGELLEWDRLAAVDDARTSPASRTSSSGLPACAAGDWQRRWLRRKDSTRRRRQATRRGDLRRRCDAAGAARGRGARLRRSRAAPRGCCGTRSTNSRGRLTSQIAAEDLLAAACGRARRRTFAPSSPDD